MDGPASTWNCTPQCRRSPTRIASIADRSVRCQDDGSRRGLRSPARRAALQPGDHRGVRRPGSGVRPAKRGSWAASGVSSISSTPISASAMAGRHGGSGDRRARDGADPRSRPRPPLRRPDSDPGRRTPGDRRAAVARRAGDEAPTGSRRPGTHGAMRDRGDPRGRTPAWGVQFHVEAGPSTVPLWATVPEYERTLAAHFGSPAGSKPRWRVISTPSTRRPETSCVASWARLRGASPDRDHVGRWSGERRALRIDGGVAGARGYQHGARSPRGCGRPPREKRLSAAAAERALRSGWSFIDAIDWWGPDDTVWRSGGSHATRRIVDVESGTPVPLRRRRRLLPGRLRTTAPRALAPFARTQDLVKRAAACGVEAPLAWEFECLVLEPGPGAPTPAMADNRCWSALTLACEDELLRGSSTR